MPVKKSTIKNKPSKQGGWRPNSGRKKLPAEKKKKPVQFLIRPDRLAAVRPRIKELIKADELANG